MRVLVRSHAGCRLARPDARRTGRPASAGDVPDRVRTRGAAARAALAGAQPRRPRGARPPRDGRRSGRSSRPRRLDGRRAAAEPVRPVATGAPRMTSFPPAPSAWERVDPKDAGFDPAGLRAAVAHAVASETEWPESLHDATARGVFEPPPWNEPQIGRAHV